MVAIPLGVSNYVRRLGRSAPILLKNMYVEKDPANLVDGTIRQQRPALSLFTTLDAGRISGIFQQPGSFNGDYFICTGGSLYRVTYPAGVATLLGIVGTDARCIMAASKSMLVIATGSVPYRYTVTGGLEVIVMPDGVNVTSVEFLNNYFILTIAESQRYYWIAPEGEDPDALSFASAENSPDDTSVCKRLGDELWFFGEGRSTEVHIATGVSDLPFKRVGGRLYDIGCANRHTVAGTDNSLFWVGTDNKVHRADATPKRISDHSIEEALRRNNSNANLSAWSFQTDGHTFYVLTIGSIGTFAYDVESDTWYHWNTYTRETWRAWIGTSGNGAPVLCGDDTNGKVYTLDPTLNEDDGVQMERIVVGGVQVIGKPVRCDSVVIYGSVGWVDDPEAEPSLEINWSDDQGGGIDGPWMQMSMGGQGDRQIEMSARQLGLINPPGRLFYFRCTEDVNLRLSFARMNEI